ncbi:MAG: penicillin-binding protein activator [Kofleriaceae bacterium]
MAGVLARWLATPAMVVVACAGCGGSRAPATSWVEHDTHYTTTHATTASVPPVPAALDAATIDRLDEAGVRAALDRIGDAEPAARLALRAARLAYHRGDDAEARAWVARATSAADEPAVHDELTELAAALAAAPIEPTKVAVLLPLTGKFSAIGKELRAAIELAPAAGTRWMFLDTTGDPEAAGAAVDTAVKQGAVAILGPVGEREAVSAARAAAIRGIAIALLAPGDGADPAVGVFRLVDSIADEARAVARLAARENFPTIGVLVPRDDAGQQAIDALAAEAGRLGVRITAQGSYDPTGGKLEADVKAFLGLIPAQNPRLAAHLARHGKNGWTTFSPDVPFTLLYVPDRYDRAALVAAFLPYFGVELRTTEFPDLAKLQRKHGGHTPQVVQLIGGAGWNHPSLPVRGGEAVQGALIVDVFAGERGGDIAAALTTEFRQRTGRDPSSAAAQAYDAATLIANARNQAAQSPEPRSAIRTALARATLDDGACGPASIASDGELVREPALLEVEDDQLVPAR